MTKKTKGKKKGKKDGKKGKSKDNDKKSEKIEITMEQKIENEKNNSKDTISMMWDYCVGDSMSEYELKREQIYKQECSQKQIQYIPKYQISYEQFCCFVKSLNLDYGIKPEMTDVGEIKNEMETMETKVFEWFDAKNEGKISFNDFEQKLAEFFVEENAKKPKKAAKKGGKTKTKGKGKGKGKGKSKKKSKKKK